MFMKYKTVIFDLDGTLLNTLDDIRDSLNVALSKFGFKERSLEEVRKAVGYASKELLARTLEGGYENPQLQTVLDYYLEYYEKHSNIKTKPYEGIIELLEELREQGVRVAIVSNKPQEAVSILSREIFGDLVELAIGESAELPRKPNPAMLLKAVEELGCAKEECVYVGDTEVDVQTARNAEMDIIVVLWGFRTKDELLKTGAKTFAADTEELGRIIRQGS
jgi:phosphoglycolate phosphatase